MEALTQFAFRGGIQTPTIRSSRSAAGGPRRGQAVAGSVACGRHGAPLCCHSAHRSSVSGDTAVQNVTNVDFRTFTDISLLPFLNRTNTSGLRPRISVSATSHRHGAPKGLDVTVSVRRLRWQRWGLREFQNLSRNDLELCSRGEFVAGGHARNAPSYQLRGPERRNCDELERVHFLRPIHHVAPGRPSSRIIAGDLGHVSGGPAQCAPQGVRIAGIWL